MVAERIYWIAWSVIFVTLVLSFIVMVVTLVVDHRAKRKEELEYEQEWKSESEPL